MRCSTEASRVRLNCYLSGFGGCALLLIDVALCHCMSRQEHCLQPGPCVLVLLERRHGTVLCGLIGLLIVPLVRHDCIRRWIRMAWWTPSGTPRTATTPIRRGLRTTERPLHCWIVGVSSLRVFRSCWAACVCPVCGVNRVVGCGWSPQ
jgi:hypothetical protein